jgi:hypothetical protein
VRPGARELGFWLKNQTTGNREAVVGIFSSHNRSDRSRELVNLLWPKDKSPISFVMTNEDILRVDANDRGQMVFEGFPSGKKKDMRKVPGYQEGDIVLLLDDSPGHVVRGQESGFVYGRPDHEEDLYRIAGLIHEAIWIGESTRLGVQPVLWNLQWESPSANTFRYREDPRRDQFYVRLGKEVLGRWRTDSLSPSVSVAVTAPSPAPTVPVAPAPALAPAATAELELDRHLGELRVGTRVRTAQGLHLELRELVSQKPATAVWRAREIDTRRLIAVKVNLAGDPGREALRADARRNKRLVDMGLGDLTVKILEAHDDYLIKEWIAGSSGTQWLKTLGPVLDPKAVEITALQQLIEKTAGSGVYVRLLEPGHVLFQDSRAVIVNNGGVLKNRSPQEVYDEYRRNFQDRWARKLPAECATKFIEALFEKR